MGLFDSLFGGKKSNTTVNPDELAETVSSEWWDAFDDYITDKNDAYFIAFQLFGRSNMIYRRFGDGSAVSEEKYPELYGDINHLISFIMSVRFPLLKRVGDCKIRM